MALERTVVAQDSHGLRQWPLGRRVGGVPAMVDGERCLVQRVLQVFVELPQHG